MAVSAKTRAKRHSHIKKGWEVGVPHFNILDYKLSLMKTFAYFAADVENKIKQEIAIKYWKDQEKDVSGFLKLSDSWFSQAGVLAYLLSNNVSLEEQDEIFLQKKYQQLYSMVQQKAEGREGEDSKPVIRIDPQIAIGEKARKLGSDIDNEIDLFCQNKSSTFDTKDFLTKNEVSAPVAKLIATYYMPLQNELKCISTDEQIEEVYSYLGKRGLKKFIDFVDNIVGSCNNVAMIAKTTRKPRKRKEKPAGVVAAKVKYLKEYIPLNIRGITPDKVVGASEVWIFNSKLRKLIRYESIADATLSWKGTTLMNWDPDKSGGKTVRKPEEIIKGLQSMTKRPLNKKFSEIKSVLANVNGRMNDDCIILSVF